MVKAHQAHTKGFTLAELLLSVAILLVLAALAFPSIVSAQNNMRMVELNNAAESIANAAQSQMTAKKVSGAWWSLVESEGLAQTKAVNLPSTINGRPTDAQNTFYITADQARKSSIVPPLAVDDSVRRGDFIIEFNVTTATVVSVFYADGKSGFFSFAPDSTNAAQEYYEAGGSRDRAARMAADYMIGYADSTPHGATPEIALQNPVVWLNENGELCVQDKNLSRNPEWKTSIEVTVSLGASVLSISGLDGTETSYTVQAGSETKTNSNTVKETKVYSLGLKGDAAQADVYAIDLNDLKRVLQEAGGQGDLAVTIGALSSSAGDIRADARVSCLEKTSVPATASAYFKWPEKVAKLSVLVTNPALEAKNNGGKSRAAHISGVYADPSVKLVTTAGEPPVTGISMISTEATFELSAAGIKTSSVLAAENIESTRQSYSGAWVKLADAREQQANVFVSAGSYTSQVGSSIDVSGMVNPGNNELLWSGGKPFEASGKQRQYQIYEIWVNGERAGYLDQGAWTWENTNLGRDLRECVQWSGKDASLPAAESANYATSLTIDTVKLYDLVEQDFDGYEIYVRTTPRADEVQAYFSSLAPRFAEYLSNGKTTTGSRGVNLGAPIRQPFENEFGASSTVALYNVTTKGGSLNLSSGAFPRQGDVRVYYTAAPAVAWGKGLDNVTTYTKLPSAQLWLYEKSDGYLSSNPSAYVRSSRSGASSDYALSKTSSADYELSTERDYLFYRAVEYCDGNGKRIDGYDVQYVPYTVQDDKTHASISSPPNKEGLAFAGWKVEGDSTYQSPSFTIMPTSNSLVGDWDSRLAFGAVKLKTQYKEVPKDSVGLMYLEFDHDNKVTGYYGTLDGSSCDGDLPGNNEIASWGYYVVVPAGAAAPEYQQGGNGQSPDNWVSLKESKVDVDFSVDGVRYDAYKAPGTVWGQSQKNTLHYPFRLGANQHDYWYNVNFAAAIAVDDGEADDWGEDDSPWNVRHADQFVGCLPAYDVQEHYVKHAFLQSHDMDLSAAANGGDASRKYNFAHAFKGIYDGGTYRITGYQLASGIGDVGAYAGLFPKASDATLKNIKIVGFEQNSASKELVTTRAGSIGILVGLAKECTIENCSVSGEGRASLTDPSLVIDIPATNGTTNVGLLVGEAENCYIFNSSATNLAVVMKNPYPSYSGPVLNVGGLVGYAKESNEPDEDGEKVGVEDCEVFAVALQASVRFDSSKEQASVRMGGLLGMLRFSGQFPYLENSQKIAVSYADLSLRSIGPESPVDSFVGSLIGFAKGNHIGYGQVKHLVGTEVYFVDADGNREKLGEKDVIGGQTKHAQALLAASVGGSAEASSRSNDQRSVAAVDPSPSDQQPVPNPNQPQSTEPAPEDAPPGAADAEDPAEKAAA